MHFTPYCYHPIFINDLCIFLMYKNSLIRLEGAQRYDLSFPLLVHIFIIHLPRAS